MLMIVNLKEGNFVNEGKLIIREIMDAVVDCLWE